MTDRLLVDTNVLAYAYDRSEPSKQLRALEILNELAARQAGVMSTQVLGEFYNAVTRRIASPLTAAQAYERIKNLVMAWPVVEITPLIILEAARGAYQHQMPIWDAQIWATAKLNQIAVILSEDLQDGAVIEGIRVVDPFRAGFALGDWV